MCTVSMVFDYYKNPFEEPYRRWVNPGIGTPTGPYMPHWPQTPSPATVTIRETIPAKELAEIRQLIADFKEALAAAKRLDVLIAQPDCEDPEKAKLEERVTALEKRLGETVGL